MPDFNASVLRRMLRLRQFPLFESADLDELATIAENLVETTIPAGTVIASANTRLDAVLLVVAGQIETKPRGQAWGPRQVFGALEVFSNRELASTAVAASEVHALRLSADDVGEVLEDNFGVLLAAVRELATRLLVFADEPARTTLAGSTGPLGLVERLIILRQQLPFLGARLQALATLAHASEEVRWPAGTVITRAGEAATSAFVIIDGAVVARRGTANLVLEAGAPIGHLEALAGAQHTATFETTTPVRALRSGTPAILDVLEDHTDVGLAMIATFAGALLDASSRLN